MTNLAYGAIALAVIAALGYGYHTVKESGYAECKLVYSQKDNKTLTDTLAALEKAQAEVKVLKEKEATDVVAIQTKHTEELNDANAKADRVISDLKSGIVQLRVRLANNQINPTPNSGTSSNTGVNSETTGSFVLGESDSAFLVSEAKRADEITIQLTAAQDLLKLDREICK